MAGGCLPLEDRVRALLGKVRPCARCFCTTTAVVLSGFLAKDAVQAQPVPVQEEQRCQQSGRTLCRAAKWGGQRGPYCSPCSGQCCLCSSTALLFSSLSPKILLCLCLPAPITSSGADPVSHTGVRWENCPISAVCLAHHSRRA